jgi:sulfur carrier protein ThiS
MTATIRLGASLKVLLGGKGEFTIEPGRSVRETLVSLNIKPELVALVSVNSPNSGAGDEQQSKDYVIQEGDVIRVLAIIGGG